MHLTAKERILLVNKRGHERKGLSPPIVRKWDDMTTKTKSIYTNSMILNTLSDIVASGAIDNALTERGYDTKEFAAKLDHMATVAAKPKNSTHGVSKAARENAAYFNNAVMPYIRTVDTFTCAMVAENVDGLPVGNSGKVNVSKVRAIIAVGIREGIIKDTGLATKSGATLYQMV